MMAVVIDAREALKGVVWMLAGREDYRSQFDVTAGGVMRSFLAAILAIPFLGLTAGLHNALAAAEAGALDPAISPYPLAYVVVRWLAAWAYFPILAWSITVLLRRREGFGPWVVVHNWTHLLVIAVNTVPRLMLALGAGQAVVPVIWAAAVFQAYAFVRAAKAALDVPWTLAGAVGGANLAALLLVDAGLAWVFLWK